MFIFVTIQLICRLFYTKVIYFFKPHSTNCKKNEQTTVDDLLKKSLP